MARAQLEYYSVDEVAKLLGFHPDTVRLWCREGKLPGARKFGRDWRIPRSALEPPTGTQTPTDAQRSADDQKGHA
jgi:excisionase family DNA binding protein